MSSNNKINHNGAISGGIAQGESIEAPNLAVVVQTLANTPQKPADTAPKPDDTAPTPAVTHQNENAGDRPPRKVMRHVVPPPTADRRTVAGRNRRPGGSVEVIGSPTVLLLSERSPGIDLRNEKRRRKKRRRIKQNRKISQNLRRQERSEDLAQAVQVTYSVLFRNLNQYFKNGPSCPTNSITVLFYNHFKVLLFYPSLSLLLNIDFNLQVKIMDLYPNSTMFASFFYQFFIYFFNTTWPIQNGIPFVEQNDEEIIVFQYSNFQLWFLFKN